MATQFLTTLTLPDTGEEVDLHIDTGDDDPADYRNSARSRGRSSGRLFGRRSKGFELVRPAGSRLPEPREAAERPRATAAQAQTQSAGTVQNNGEYLAIRKEALAGLVGIAGDFWAAYMGRPGMPAPTGDPIADNANAAMHRDALAQHAQNCDRIRAISGLAERALRVLLS